MQAQSNTVEAKLALMAADTHGVVTRRQLLGNGISRQEVASRLRRGDLLREHSGVYRVGHRAPSLEATYLAAVLAAGEGAVLSGPAAAHLWGLVRGKPPEPEVTCAAQRRIKGVATRRSSCLGAGDVTVFRGIPITTVARTVADIAAVVSDDLLARACHEAGVRYGLTPRAVEEVLDGRPRTPGAGRLRRITAGDVHVTLSVLEARFLRLLREQGLPLPVTNRRAGGHRVDCRWPEHRLTVELDSYRFHNSRHAWESDRRREREARARGDDFRRYTYGDVSENPAAMLRELHAALDARRPG
jgi:very-short-patch-repair endonuclease